MAGDQRGNFAQRFRSTREAKRRGEQGRRIEEAGAIGS